MAGVGDAWGTRESMLHPRDSHGRFRSKWKMSAAVVDKLMAFLGSFNPKMFGNDQEGGGYVQELGRSGRRGYGGNAALGKFLRDPAAIQAKLRSGDSSSPDVKAIDDSMTPLPDDVILTRITGPKSWGLTPETIGQVEEYTGHLVSDKGYTSASIGTPLPHAGPAITMTIATPAGTKAAIPRSNGGREVILDRDQPLRITKVDSDGKGGFYVLAVAETKGAPGSKRTTKLGGAPPAPEPGLPQPQQAPGAPAAPGAPEAPAAVAPAAPAPGVLVPQKKIGRPAGPPPAPRNDGHVAEAIGGKPVAPDATPQTPEGVPEVPGEPIPQQPGLPKTPAADPRSTFRGAFKKADLKSPSEGKRRQQFNEAYLGTATGKKTPQEAVETLEHHITLNESILKSDKEDGTDSGPLPGDIKAQKDLAQLIKDHFGLEGAKTGEKSAPTKKVAPKTDLLRTPETHRTQLKKEPAPKKSVEQVDAEVAKGERERRGAIRKDMRAKSPRPEPKATVPKKVEPTPEEEARDRAARTISDKWLNAAGVKDSELSDLEKTGLRVVAGDVAAKRISNAEGLRRLGDSSKGNLAKIGAGAPAKRAAAPKKAAGPVKDDLSNATIPQLREEAKKRGIKIPASARKKEDIRQAILTGKTEDKRSLVDQVKESRFRGEAEDILDSKQRSQAELRQVARGLGLPASSKDSPEDLRKRILDSKGKILSDAGPNPDIPQKVEAATTIKPSRATTKGHGGSGIMLYYGRGAKPTAEPKRVKVNFDRGLAHITDVETGKKIESVGVASKFWAAPDAPLKKVDAPEVSPEKVEASIREVLPDLAKELGTSWVPLADLREKLSNLDRKDVDKALESLAVQPDVQVIGWDNGKALTPRDKAAALHFGGEDNHAIRLEAPATKKIVDAKNAEAKKATPVGPKAKDIPIEVVKSGTELDTRDVMNGRTLTPAGRTALESLGPDGHAKIAAVPTAEGKVRAAVAMLQVPGEPGRYTNMEDLRSLIGNQVSREELDKTLRDMSHMPGIDIVPQSYDRGFRTQQRQANAVIIGGQENNLIRISGSEPKKSATPEAPKAPTPSAPEKAAGTAKGKLTAARVAPGTRILVRKDAKGDWAPTSTKTGATAITVTSKDASTAGGRRGGMRRTSAAGYVITGTDNRGNEIKVKPVGGSQTFWIAPLEFKSLEEAKARRVEAPKSTATVPLVTRKRDAVDSLRGLSDQFKGFPSTSEKQGAIGSASDAVSNWSGELEQGKITPQEAISRLNQLDRRLGHGGDPESNKVHAAIVKAINDIKPTVAVKEIKVPKAIQEGVARTSINDLRDQAREAGIKVPGSVKTKPQLMDFITQELAKQEAIRRGEAVDVPTPKVVKDNPYNPISVEDVIAEAGLDNNLLNEYPTIVAHVQEQLNDGKHTPGAVNRDIISFLRGPSSPGYRSVVMTQVGQGKRTPQQEREVQAEVARLNAVSAEFKKLAEAVGKVKRSRKPAATTPAKKATPAKAASMPRSSADILKAMKAANTREGAHKEIEGLTIPQLRQFAKDNNIAVSGDKKHVQADIVEWTVGRNLDRAAIEKLDLPASRVPAKSTPATGKKALAAAPIDLTRGVPLRGPDSLTDQQHSSIRQYKGTAFDKINYALRESNGDMPTKSTGFFGDLHRESIANIDAALDRSTLTSDVEVFRGIRDGRDVFGDAWDGPLTGAEWTEYAFMSTTSDEAVARGSDWGSRFYDPDRGAIFKVRAPKGTKGMVLSDDKYESELLLQRGLRLKVVSDTGPGRGRVIEVEVVKR